MDDLFKKLNVLIKSSLHDVVGDDASRRNASPPRLGRDIDREIAALRQRVNDAAVYEDELKARITSLEAEIARVDQQADEAVEQRREEQARYLIEQMQRAQQRLTIARADLREHQLVAQELLQRVNMLETYVAEARRQQQAAPETSAGGLADLLRSARDKLAREPQVEPHREMKTESVDGQAVEDDLERRRQRLSKR
jgi:phage shock protein A